MNEIVKNCLITDTITDCEVKENNEDDKIKISTITMSSRFPDCVLNLTNIGKYLPIDNEIIGIKYKFGNINVMKGTYSTTIYKKSKIKNPDKINSQLFYNQISIIYNHNGNHINVKLFGNGSLHLTGCKTIESGEEITKGIYKKLNNIRNMTDKILLTKDLNGILLDKDKLVEGPFGSNACYEQSFEQQGQEIKTWLCFGSGFTTSTLMTEGSKVVQDLLETSPELYKDLLHTDKDKKVWAPATITLPEKGMVFLDGSNKEQWKWASVRSVPITEEDRKTKSFPSDQTHKMDMNNIKHFEQNDFMTALENIDFYKL